MLNADALKCLLQFPLGIDMLRAWLRQALESSRANRDSLAVQALFHPEKAAGALRAYGQCDAYQKLLDVLTEITTLPIPKE
ncbi:MAG: hypothetical protein LBQ12_14175 [Deltaproteobacteria bacterium]|jgi:hypothetical protein|nr:hypothetical protein [Deltaproteobacteria bacterium]